MSTLDGQGDPTALRLRFLRARVRARLREAGELGSPQGGGTTTAARNLVDVFVQAFLRVRWCHDVEDALESGTQFLRDNWDNLTAEQRAEFEKELAELLDSYAETCG